MNKPLDPRQRRVTRAEVEDFLYHEAALLDDWQLDEWLGAADRRRRLLRAAERQARRRSSLHAVHHRRRHRAHPRAHHPPQGPELPRRVSAVAHPAADHQRAHHRHRGRPHPGAANFAIFRYRRNEPAPRQFVGRYRHKLKRTDAGLKIHERRAILDAEEFGAMGAVSFLL